MRCSAVKRSFQCFYSPNCVRSKTNYLNYNFNKPPVLTALHVRYISKESESVTPLSITNKRKQLGETNSDNSVSSSDKPIVFIDRSDFLSKYPPKSLSKPRQAWIESIDADNESRDLVTLHPDIWGIRPRIDVLWTNIDWQKRYKTVLYNDVKDRYDMHEGPPPWPRKGTGHARHRSKGSPNYYQGGKAHGPRGPRTDFFMLQYPQRVTGLIHCLSAKFAQDDVRIVQNLEIPSEKPEYVEDLIENRGWGMSTLFVDKNDVFPRNLTAATQTIFHVNMMPVYGLNVYSMLKHKTLVLTLDALQHIEEKLLFALCRADIAEKCVASSTTGQRLY